MANPFFAFDPRRSGPFVGEGQGSIPRSTPLSAGFEGFPFAPAVAAPPRSASVASVAQPQSMPAAQPQPARMPGEAPAQQAEVEEPQPDLSPLTFLERNFPALAADKITRFKDATRKFIADKAAASPNATSAELLAMFVQSPVYQAASKSGIQGTEKLIKLAETNAETLRPEAAEPIKARPGDVFLDPTTLETRREIPQAVSPQSALAKITQDRRNNFISQEDFLAQRRELLRSDEPVVEVADPANPGRTKFVRRSQAVGMAGPPPKAGVTVNTGERETTFQKTLGKQRGEAVSNMIEVGQNAVGTEQTLREMADLFNQDLQTGSLRPAITSLQGVAADLGLDLEDVANRLGVPLGDLATSQQFNRLATNVVIDGFQKFKGNLNSEEVRIALDAFAGLGTSEEANIDAIASGLAAAAIARDRGARASQVTTAQEAAQLQREILQGDTTRFMKLKEQFKTDLTNRSRGEGEQPGSVQTTRNGIAVPTALQGEPDGTIVERDDGQRFEKRGNQLVPLGGTGGGAQSPFDEGAGPDLSAAERRVRAAFPGIARMNFTVQAGSGPGFAEFYPADEGRNPNPGTPTIEVRSLDQPPEVIDAIILGDALHAAPRQIPAFAEAKKQFIASLKPSQTKVLRSMYVGNRRRNPEDRRSFAEFVDQSGADAFIRDFFFRRIGTIPGGRPFVDGVGPIMGTFFPDQMPILQRMENIIRGIQPRASR